MQNLNNDERQRVNGNSGRSDQMITITVRTTQGVLTRDYDKNTQLVQILEAVKQEYGFAPDGNYELIRKLDNSALDLQRPVVSYGLRDGEVLTFTDLGKAA